MFFLILLMLSPQESVLTVVLDEVKESRGSILICLCNVEDVFTETCFESAEVPAEEGRQEVIFEHLPEGFYGISVLHDLNDNGEMDRNIIGLPKEPFGFSEVTGLITKIPSFEKCKFEVVGSTTVTIKMR